MECPYCRIEMVLGYRTTNPPVVQEKCPTCPCTSDFPSMTAKVLRSIKNDTNIVERVSLGGNNRIVLLYPSGGLSGGVDFNDGCDGIWFTDDQVIQIRDILNRWFPPEER